MKRIFLFAVLTFLFVATNATAISPWDRPLLLNVKTPYLAVTSVYIGNNFNPDGTGTVEVHIQTDYPVGSTVQVLLAINTWCYSLDIIKHGGSIKYSWKWVTVSYNIFIPAYSTDGWAYGILANPGEYASTTAYSIYGPYVL